MKKVILLVQRHPDKSPVIVSICDSENVATQLEAQYWAKMSNERHAQLLNYFEWQIAPINELTNFRPGNGSSFRR